MAMNYAEFKQSILRDKQKLEKGEPPKGVKTCAECNIPLMESVTGNRPLGDGRHLCSDDYFDLWGDYVDAHPIYSPRLSQRG